MNRLLQEALAQDSRTAVMAAGQRIISEAN